MGHQIGNNVGVTDKRQVTGEFGPVPANADSLATNLNYADEAALDARLTAISGTTYTTAVLRQMTQNDKIFAVRSNDDAAGIK
jgi:hypothetical protein